MDVSTRYEQRMQRNIKLFLIWKIFTKRTYLPLIVIFAVEYAGVSLVQVGLIAAITSVVSLLLEIPSGYFADKIGHKNALVLGAFLTTVAPLGYVFYPNFYGVLFGSAIFFAGVAFHSGTIQAFIHETLSALGRTQEFSTINARAQRYGLIGNIILISLVPLTYVVDPRLPFVLGFLLLMLGLIVVSLFTNPKTELIAVKDRVADGFWSLIRVIHNRGEFIFFIFLGVAAATVNKLPEFREIYYQDIGVPLWSFGILLAISNIVGIFFTYTTVWFESMDSKKYYLLDYLWISIFSIVVGVTTNPFLGAVLFVVFAGYARVRQIIIYAKLLETCPTKNLKATYLSVYSFFAAVMGIWIPIVLGFVVGNLGVRGGYLVFGVGILLLMTLLFYLSKKVHKL